MVSVDCQIGYSESMNHEDELKSLLNMSRRYERLTREDEHDLCEKIKAGMAAQKKIKNGSKNKGLPALVAIGEEAKTRFVLSNLKLVVSIARRYNKDFLTLSDLVQEGTMGLMRAVEKFDSSKGFKFSTYASWWIKQALTRASYGKNQIRIPVWRMPLAKEIERLVEDGVTSNEDIADLLDVTLDQVLKARSLPKVTVSLDQPILEDGGTLGDLLSSEDVDPDFEIRRKEAIATLSRALEDVTEKEKTILLMRFGGDGDTSMEAIGGVFGLSRERVRQILMESMGKVRKSIEGM